MNELDAFADLETRLQRRVSTQVVPFAWGEAFLDDDLPTRFYSNFLLADGDLEDVSARDLIGAAEEILGGGAFEHRLVIMRDARAADRLDSGFTAAGFERSGEAIKIHRRDPDRPGALHVEEARFAEVRDLIVATYLEDDHLPSELAVPFTDHRAKYERELGARFFVALVDGEPAGHCELYLDGDEAQVENVATLVRFRNRGAARSAVLAAVDAARASGAERTYIVADDDDGPRSCTSGWGSTRRLRDGVPEGAGASRAGLEARPAYSAPGAERERLPFAPQSTSGVRCRGRRRASPRGRRRCAGGRGGTAPSAPWRLPGRRTSRRRSCSNAPNRRARRTRRSCIALSSISRSASRATPRPEIPVSSTFARSLPRPGSWSGR